MPWLSYLGPSASELPINVVIDLHIKQVGIYIKLQQNVNFSITFYQKSWACIIASVDSLDRKYL